jgi:tetratricopeptide (TPR) repeat protein
MFKSAFSLDKRFAAAYAELAHALWLANFYGWSEGTAALEDAIIAARKSIALDPSLPQGFAHLSNPLAFQGNFDEGIAAARQAVKLDRNYATGYAKLSNLLIFNSEFEEAHAAANNAVKLDPYSPLSLTMRGAAHFYAGNYKRAIPDFQASIIINPDFGGGHQYLAATYGWLGEEEKARVEAAEVLRLSPNFAANIFQIPGKYREVRMRLVDGLRKAGLDVPDAPVDD